jgi:hypothetical protein
MTEQDPIKADFRNFLHLAWKFLGYTDSELQYDIAHYLQHGPDRLMISAMRGAGKSVIDAAFAAWWLYCDPNATILCVSAASTRSREFIRFTRRILEMPICQHLIPNEFDRDGADRFDCGAWTHVDKNPSVAAYGINAMITGTHVDLIICDDIETRNNSLTIDARDKLYSQCMEFESVLNPGGRIVYLGTPQSVSSVYLRLAKHYELRKWPARYPSLDDQDGLLNLSPTLLEKIQQGTATPGDSTFPEKFSDLTLLEREAIMGPTEWQLQMMLNTRLSDALKYPLKAKDFIVYTTSGDMAPRNISWGTSMPMQIPCAGLDGDRFYGPIYTDPVFETTSPKTMYVDPAGTGGDEIGIAIGSALNGFLYVQLATGIPGGHGEENMIKIARMALAFGVKRILVEPNYGDGMFTKTLMPHVLRICGQVAVEDDKRVTNTKEIRICDTLEAPLSNHRIIISEQVAHDEDFIYQLTHITRDPGCLRHDDRIDAFAGLVRSFSNHIQIDVQSRIEKADQAAREQAYRDFEISWKQSKLGRKVVKGSPEDPHVAGNKIFSKSTRWGKSLGW